MGRYHCSSASEPQRRLVLLTTARVSPSRRLFAALRTACGALTASLFALGGTDGCKPEIRPAPSDVAGATASVDGAIEGGLERAAVAHEGGSAAATVSAATDLPLTVTSRTIDLKLAFGETRSGEVRLMGKLAAAARLSVKTVDPPGPSVTILSAEGPLPQGVRVTVAGSEVGRRAGQVSLATGLADPKELTVLYSWQVLGNLNVDPTNPFIDLRAPPPVGVDVRVASRLKDFRLDQAQIVSGPFQATVARDDAAGGYVVHVSAVDSGSNDDSRGTLGTIRLLSNDPAEPQKDVQVFALGPLRR